MLKADSSTLKSESELQSRTTAADDAEGGGVVADGVERMVDRHHRGAREDVVERVLEALPRLAVPGRTPEQREGEKEHRHQREQGEVGDHRRQVGAAIGEKLLEQLAFSYTHRQSVSLLRGLPGKYLALGGVASRASANGLEPARPASRDVRELLLSARVWTPSRHSAELAEISSQIELALIFNSRGELIGTTLADRQAAEALAFAAAALLMCSSQAAGEEHGEPTQVELSYPEASVLLVREGDLRILALASPDLDRRARLLRAQDLPAETHRG